jgi:hypothetical protein
MSQDASIGGMSISEAQSEDDKACVKQVLKTFERLKKHRSKYDKQWMHYYKMFRGDQWDGVRMPRHRQREVINLVWQAIQSSMPLQTDARPQLNFIPEEPADMPFVTTLNDIYDSDAQRFNWLMTVCEVILDGYLYGIGYGFTGYDPEIDFGVGAAVFRSEDPFYCYPDAEATDINSECEDRLFDSREFIVAKPVCTQRLKAKYKEHAEQIKADIRDVVQSTKTALNDYKVRTSNADLDMPDVSWYSGQEASQEKTMLIIAYLKPSDTEDVEEGEGEEIKYITRKKYPKGRRVVIANGLKLEESELPFEHGKIPYAKYVNYILPREFFGVSEVEQLESPQRMVNKIINAQLEIMGLMGNPVWVVSTDSGVNPHKLINQTGLVVQKEPGSEVQRMDGIQLSTAALSLVDRTVDWFNNIAGSQDVSRGQTPGSVTAASAIEQLQDAARTRIRQKQRNLDAFLREHGQQYQGIVLEKYSKPRVFRVTNDQGSTQYFKAHTDKIKVPMPGGGEQDAYQATIRGYTDNGSGVPIPEMQLRQHIIQGRFDVRSNTGSSLPFSIAEKEQKALNLFDRQIIDGEEVLKIMDYPDRENILARMQEKQAAMAAQQQGA